MCCFRFGEFSANISLKIYFFLLLCLNRSHCRGCWLRMGQGTKQQLISSQCSKTHRWLLYEEFYLFVFLCFFCFMWWFGLQGPIAAQFRTSFSLALDAGVCLQMFWGSAILPEVLISNRDKKHSSLLPEMCGAPMSSVPAGDLMCPWVCPAGVGSQKPQGSCFTPHQGFHPPTANLARLSLAQKPIRNQ